MTQLTHSELQHYLTSGHKIRIYPLDCIHAFSYELLAIDLEKHEAVYSDHLNANRKTAIPLDMVEEITIAA